MPRKGRSMCSPNNTMLLIMSCHKFYYVYDSFHATSGRPFCICCNCSAATTSQFFFHRQTDIWSIAYVNNYNVNRIMRGARMKAQSLVEITNNSKLVYQKFLKISINRFNPASCLCLTQTRTRISKVICRGHFWIQWVNVKGDHCLCC